MNYRKILKSNLFIFLSFLVIFYAIFRYSESFDKGYDITEDFAIINTDQSLDTKSFVTVYKDTTGWYSSKRLNEKVSAFKILIEKKTDLILGAHLLGYNADEIINIFALAMNNDIKAGELRKTIFTYPTNASDISSMLKVN